MTAEDLISRDDLVKVSENQVALYDRLDALEQKLLAEKKTPEQIAEEERKKPLTEEKLQKILTDKEKADEEKRIKEKTYNEAVEVAAEKFNKVEESIKALCEKHDIPFKESVFNRISNENIKLGNAEMAANKTMFDWKKFEQRVREEVLDTYDKKDDGEKVEKKEIKAGSKSLTGLQDEVSMDVQGKGADRVSELERIAAGHFRAKAGNPRAGDRELSYEELNTLDREVNHARNQLRRGQYR